MYKGTGFRKTASSPERGFTLLEVIIALAIISGVIVTILTTLNYHLGAADRIESMTTAAVLAREKVEDINLNGLPSEKEGDFAPGFPGFRWQYYTEDLPIPGIKKVYLTVTWGGNNKVVIETYKQT